MTLSEAAKLLAEKKCSSVELTKESVSAIEQYDTALGSFLCIDVEGGMKAAKESDERRSRNESKGILDGVVLAIKDNILQQGMPCTAGSKMLSHFSPVYEAHVVSALRNAGAVLIGKTNLDEFGMGSSTENSAFQITRNPYDASVVPGGSSGGSAVCVAAQMVQGALGTDTGGSIRQPASFNNLVGLKPTYGRVSRHGVVAFASSLDQVGPLARTVDDVAAIYDAIAGFDANDSTTSRAQVESMGGLALKGKTIGLPIEYLGEGVDDSVRTIFENAKKVFESLGAQVKEISLPHTKYSLAAYYVLASAEASSNLARYDGVRFGHQTENPKSVSDLYERSRAEGFGREVKRRIMLGAFALSAGFQEQYYGQAQKVRALVRQDFTRVFNTGVDFIASPVSPSLPWKLGDKIENPLRMYLMDVMTIPVSLAGLPAVSVPAGFSNELPVGIQLIAPHFQEASLLSLAKQFESANPLYQRVPPLLETRRS
jgi:aspartyl-tRNA(Asn)/glutamyl-tRNA(Gln) amidotransferase subunit A